MDAPVPSSPSRWRRARRVFRWCRVLVWLGLLALLGAFLYLNQVGVPEAVKAALQEALRARGLDVEFTRLGWRWFRGLVAEQVTLGSTRHPDEAGGFAAQCDELALGIHLPALLQRRLQVASLEIRQGELVLPLSTAEEVATNFVVGNVSARLRFQPGDAWDLEDFRAECLGAALHLSGTIAHASALRDWRRRPRDPAAPAAARVWQRHLRQAVRLSEQMRFGQAPVLRVELHGDARQPASFVSRLRLEARGAATPWGTLETLTLTARLNDARSGADAGADRDAFATELTLTADDYRFREVGARDVAFTVRLEQPATHALPTGGTWHLHVADFRAPPYRALDLSVAGASTRVAGETNLWDTRLTAQARRLVTPWATGSSNLLRGTLQHALAPVAPRRTDATFETARVESPWGTVRRATVSATLRPRPPAPGVAGDDWGAWARFEPWGLRADVTLEDVAGDRLAAERLHLDADWQAPRLHLRAVEGRLYGGRADLDAALDVATRAASARVRSDFDLRQLGPLLSEGARRWLGQFDWATPPQVAGRAALTLPAWTNRAPDWRAEVLPTLDLEGEVRGAAASYRGVEVASFASHLRFTNATWHLPDLQVTRPEGTLVADYTEDTRTRDYHWRLRGGVHPQALAPLLDEAAQRVLRAAEFTSPPQIEGEIWGRWFARERTGLSTTLAVSNFVFRGAACDVLRAELQFTNGLLGVTSVTARHGDQWVSADGVGYDLARRLLFLTNAQSVVDPHLVGRTIGPRTAEVLEPYQFGQPPRARVNGRIATDQDPTGTDVTFEVEGGPFRWWRFQLPAVRGRVHWRDHTVAISDLSGPFYRGGLHGRIDLDFTHPPGAEFRCHLVATNADLHALLADIHSPTNRLEGRVDCDLTVAQARTENWGSWQGFGTARMRDGLLWDFPMFGLVSPVLNAVAPGVGSSRARSGQADFQIVDSVIRTENLEISSPPMRLAYQGTVDFAGRVNARVQAEMLREVWLVGPLISFALSPLSKVFEFHVTGTLGAPDPQPVYIPKFVAALLRPLHTLKKLLPPEPEPPARAPPPSPKPPQR